MKTKTIKTPRNWRDLKPHPLSALVEFGAGVDLDALAEHMRRHGFDPDEAIVLHDGMVLDGRHRLNAAIKAGIVPTFRQFAGKNAMAYVAKKLFRQHLNASQRALMAATLAKLYLPNGQTAHVQEKETREGGDAQICALPGNPPTLEEAAAALNVSPRLVDAARVVEERGTPAQKRDVRVGKASVSAVANEILSSRPKRPRQPGDDTEQIRADRSAKKAEPKNGAEKFKWREFGQAWGALLRQVDKLGNAYDCKESPDAEDLREKLTVWKHGFESLYRRVAGQEPPKG